jgi:hypothetical protein
VDFSLNNGGSFVGNAVIRADATSRFGCGLMLVATFAFSSPADRLP